MDENEIAPLAPINAKRGRNDYLPQAERNRGWVRLHRRLLEHPRCSDPDWVAVWVYLLLNATHAPIRKVFNGRDVILRPGQLICGRYVIATATGVHPSKVQRVLTLLKIDQQIDQQGGNKSSIITILNWALYQGVDQQIDQQTISSRSTNDQQSITLQEQKNIRSIESAERPSLGEVKDYAQMIGLAEWKAEDWFDEMQGGGWLDHNHRPIDDWRAVLRRVRKKWEADGRPMSPPSNAPRQGTPGTPQPAKAVPIWQQLKSCQTLLEQEQRKLLSIGEKAACLMTKEEAEANKKVRAPIVAEIRRLKARIEELNRQAAEGNLNA